MTEMRNLGALARKSRVIELPGGMHVELRALVLSDWATLWEETAHAMRRDLIETYARNADLLPEARRQDVVMEAFRRAEAITANTIKPDDVVAFLKTSRGELLCLWLSMRPGMPGLTYDEAAVIWSVDREHVKAAADTVGELSRATLGNAQPPLPAQAT